MYTTIRRYHTSPEAVAEIIRRVREGFVPIIQQAPGFVAYYVLDEGNGVLASMSIFEDQAGAEESTRRSAQWVQEHLVALLPTPPQVTTAQVVVHSLGVRTFVTNR